MKRLAAAVSIGLLCSCESARRIVKAKPAERSAFLERPQEMKRQPATAAFQYEWQTTDRAARAKAQKLKRIYVAPVSLKHLRPMKTGAIRGSGRRGTVGSAEAPRLAEELRNAVVAALGKVPNGRYRVASRPGPNAVSLEMTLTELNPTNPGLNAAKLAASIALGPVATIGGLAIRSTGNAAVEGRLRAGSRGPVIYQFADNEADKFTLYSVRDLKPYGHVRVSIKEWAEQLAAIVQSPPGTRVRDATFWTLSPL